MKILEALLTFPQALQAPRKLPFILSPK